MESPSDGREQEPARPTDAPPVERARERRVLARQQRAAAREVVAQATAQQHQQAALLEAATALSEATRALMAITADRRADATGREECRSHLRSCVADYTLRLRRAGEPPEQALVLVKAAVGTALSADSDWRRHGELEAVVHWFVETYYAA